jgi:hypothetical protein
LESAERSSMEGIRAGNLSRFFLGKISKQISKYRKSRSFPAVSHPTVTPAFLNSSCAWLDASRLERAVP